MNIYLCDFAKRSLLSFRLNTGIAPVQTSVAGKYQGACRLARCRLRAQAQTYPWVGGFLVLCENQGGREGRLEELVRVLCQKAVQSQRIFHVA